MEPPKVKGDVCGHNELHHACIRWHWHSHPIFQDTSNLSKNKSLALGLCFLAGHERDTSDTSRQKKRKKFSFIPFAKINKSLQASSKGKRERERELKDHKSSANLVSAPVEDASGSTGAAQGREASKDKPAGDDASCVLRFAFHGDWRVRDAS
jgi:hypothetical protein